MLNAGGGGGRSYTQIFVTKHWLSIVKFADHGSQKLSAKCSPLCAEHRLKISQSNYDITPLHILGHKASPNQNFAAYLGSQVNRTILIIHLFVLYYYWLLIPIWHLTFNTEMPLDLQYIYHIGLPVHISHWTSNPDITLDFLYRYDCGIPILTLHWTSNTDKIWPSMLLWYKTYNVYMSLECQLIYIWQYVVDRCQVGTVHIDVPCALIMLRVSDIWGIAIR